MRKKNRTRSLLIDSNRFFYLFVLILLSSCASLNNDQVAPSWTFAYKAVKNAVFGYPDLNITREVIENIPYASALLKVGKGTEGLVILESIQNDKYLWVSGDNVYVLIKDGRIERSIGLSNNLTNIISIDQSFEDLLTLSNPVTEYSSYYSFEKPTLFDLKVSVSIENKGMQEIEILGEKRNLLLIEETIASEQIGWKEKNKFWVDPEDYFVWKSIQNISPKLPEFTFQITKKPAS